jgi:hypothetical protein
MQMLKVTYMYWQKRFDRENPDQELEDNIQEIRSQHKDYGYRRMTGELKNQGYCVNKKKVQRIMQKLGLQVTSFTRKSRKYSSYRGKVGTAWLRTGYDVGLTRLFRTRRLQPTRQNSNTIMSKESKKN